MPNQVSLAEYYEQKRSEVTKNGQVKIPSDFAARGIERVVGGGLIAPLKRREPRDISSVKEKEFSSRNASAWHSKLNSKVSRKWQRFSSPRLMSWNWATFR